MKQRGHVLLICLWFLPMFVLLGALIYTPAMLRVGSSKRLHRVKSAGLTADAALATAVARIRKESTWGQQNPEVVNVTYEDSQAVVFFGEPSDALKANTPVTAEDRSLNLVSQDASKPLPSDPGTIVYAGQVHLVAVSTCQGMTVRKQVRLSIPPFPFAIASSGSFATSGSLLLGSLKPGLDVHGTWGESDLLPAEVIANGVSADALVLRGEALIVGNATTPGGAQTDNSVQFLRGGSLRTGAKPEQLPVVDIAKFDPSGRAGVQTLPDASYADLKAIEGLSRHTGPVTFSRGLRLNGMLYVDGDVVIDSGGLTGSGALVCTGKVTIRGGSDFVADSRCAVLAADDLSVSGTGKDASYYQGLLYSAGSGGISVNGITLLGAAVASAPSGAKIEVKDARVVFDSKATHVSTEVGFPADVYPPGGFPSQGVLGQGSGFLRLKPLTLPGPPTRTVSQPTPATFAAARVTTLDDDNFELVDAQGNPVPGDVGQALNVYLGPLSRMNEVLTAANPNDPLTPEGKFDFDLNRFVKVADRLRIVWRD